MNLLLQQIAEESQIRIELQMALDSKDSDIEQLRCQLQTIHIGLDNSSICGPGDVETDDSFPGKIRPSLFWKKRRHITINDSLFWEVTVGNVIPSSFCH